MAASKEKFAIIDVPLFRSQSSIFFQIYHKKPIFSGNGEASITEVPDHTKALTRKNTFLQYLLLSNTKAFEYASYRDEDVAALRRLSFKYIVVNRNNLRNIIAHALFEELFNEALVKERMMGPYGEMNGLFTYDWSRESRYSKVVRAMDARLGPPVYADGDIRVYGL